MSLATGTRLGRDEVRSRIGKGGIGRTVSLRRGIRLSEDLRTQADSLRYIHETVSAMTIANGTKLGR